MKWYIRTVLGVALCLIFESCKNEAKLNLKPTDNRVLSKGSILVADSIIYDVVIRDIDNEDPWESERLKTFKQDVFVDNIFDELYNEKLSAYDFMTGEKLSIKDIKNIEKSEGYSRSKISKVQFNEQWVIDSLGVLNKKINSMIFGIESYSKQGTFTGHKALFKVYTNPNAQ